MMKKQVYLPRCVTKKELYHYFGCKPDFLREQLITEDLIISWGFDYEPDYGSRRQLGPFVTRKIYEHFNIVDLNQKLSDEMLESLEQKKEVA